MTDRLDLPVNPTDDILREYALVPMFPDLKQVEFFARGRNGVFAALEALIRRYFGDASPFLTLGNTEPYTEILTQQIQRLEEGAQQAAERGRAAHVVHQYLNEAADVRENRDRLLGMSEFLASHEEITPGTLVDDPRLDEVFVPAENPTSEDVDHNALNLFYGFLSEYLKGYKFLISTPIVFE